MSEQPSIYGFALYPRFLTMEECDHLVELGKVRLQPSTVLSSRPGESELHRARTSSGGFIGRKETLTVEIIEERIAAVVGVPATHGEGMQVLRYEPGQLYEPHYDWFGVSDAHASWIGASGQRTHTVVLYLNDDFQEGETSFPFLSYGVKPKKGMALVFGNTLPDGTPEQMALHGGSPPTEGTKFVATKWIRQRPWPNGT